MGPAPVKSRPKKSTGEKGTNTQGGGERERPSFSPRPLWCSPPFPPSSLLASASEGGRAAPSSSSRLFLLSFLLVGPSSRPFSLSFSVCLRAVFTSYLSSVTVTKNSGKGLVCCCSSSSPSSPSFVVGGAKSLFFRFSFAPLLKTRLTAENALRKTSIFHCRCMSA